ncbi:MAG: GHKL domain-containing protein [Ruminococcus sp.]
MLNAIVNVELEKAVTNGIEFTVNIRDDLMELSDSSDIVSVIGNLCDNAVEYLCTISEKLRKMSLDISVHGRYHVITCRNRILKSVLAENPSLKSSKQDLNFHGKGTEILKNISQKYGGDIRIYEENNFFCYSVILKIQSREAV